MQLNDLIVSYVQVTKISVYKSYIKRHNCFLILMLITGVYISVDIRYFIV